MRGPGYQRQSCRSLLQESHGQCEKLLPVLSARADSTHSDRKLEPISGAEDEPGCKACAVGLLGGHAFGAQSQQREEFGQFNQSLCFGPFLRG